MPPRDKASPSGPPEATRDHLVEVHSRNGTLDKLLASAIGPTLETDPETFEYAILPGLSVSGGQGLEPWIYDGESVTLLADINPGAASSIPGDFVEFDGKIFFSAYDGISIGRNDLKVYDPADGSVSLADDTVDFLRVGGSAGAGFAEFDGKLFFTGYTPDVGHELFVYDPGTGLVTLVDDINTDPRGIFLQGSSSPGAIGGFVEYAGDLYFTARDPVHGYELRRYDAETGQVELVADINPGAASSNAGYIYSVMYDLTDDNAWLTFQQQRPPVEGFIEYDGKLYFTANDGVHGYELFSYDAASDTVELAADILPGPGGSTPGMFGFAVVGDKLLFTAQSAAEGRILHSYDATTEAVVSFNLDGTNFGSNPGAYSNFTLFDGDLYFAAATQALGYELFRYDTALEDVVLAADINSNGSSRPGFYGDMVEYQGHLYFSSFDNLSGYELSRYDPATGQVDTFDFDEGEVNSGNITFGSRARPVGVVDGQLVVYAELDLDDDGTADGRSMLVADGPITTVDDFTVVDDGSGTFRVSGTDIDLFVFETLLEI